MALKGIPVVISQNGKGTRVMAVASKAPLMTVATNGRGMRIVVVASKAPKFVIQGYVG